MAVYHLGTFGERRKSYLAPLAELTADLATAQNKYTADLAKEERAEEREVAREERADVRQIGKEKRSAAQKALEVTAKQEYEDKVRKQTYFKKKFDEYWQMDDKRRAMFDNSDQGKEFHKQNMKINEELYTEEGKPIGAHRPRKYEFESPREEREWKVRTAREIEEAKRSGQLGDPRVLSKIIESVGRAYDDGYMNEKMYTFLMGQLSPAFSGALTGALAGEEGFDSANEFFNAHPELRPAE